MLSLVHVHVHVPRTAYIETNNGGILKQAESAPSCPREGVLIISSLNGKTRHENML